MEVYAKCRFDYECIKELTHVSLWRMLKPKTALITTIICVIIVFLISILVAIFWGIEAISFELLCVLIVCLGLEIYMYWGLPKIRYNSLKEMKEMENEYIFGDEIIKISSKNEYYNGEAELKYAMIPKVIETSKYFFVFQSNNQVFVIDKSTITNGTIEDIRAKLAQYVSPKKYNIKRI